MSSARPHANHSADNSEVAMEGRMRHLDVEDASKLKFRMNDVNFRLNSLHVPGKQGSASMPSPFNGSLSNPSIKPASRSPNIGHPLKLDTTPEALNDDSASDFLTFKPVQSYPSTTPASNVVSPLSSPLNTGLSASAQKSTGGITGGNAAEMQARILALQRSRSKRVVPGSQINNSPFSPQLPSQQRRTSSSASANTIKSNLSIGNFTHASSPRSSASTLDTTESDSDEGRSNPSQEKLYNSYDSKSFPTNNEPSSVDSVHSGSFVSDSLPSAPPSAGPTPKQPLASNGFDPNTVISPTAASFAASGAAVSLSRASSFRTRQRSSLSARRGMKLDPATFQCSEKADENSKGNQGASRGDVNSFCSSKQREILAEQEALRGGAPMAPRESGNRGLFRDYRKYIDIETGSLNFAGKACVHARGIEFSSGEKFNISIDKLQFISELGSGNYGTVQKVLHTPNGVFMAVKEIRLELDEASLRQIIMELDVLHRCEMSNIIAFYGAFFVEGSVYICMEYMDGGSINKIYQGGIPEKYLKYIVRSVVAGLKQLKEQFNIIHRDVKPTNILCSTTGQIKLCDFGVSGNLVASIARTNIGCQAYMAPERIKVDHIAMENPNQPNTYTAESDIWSLGLSIIEMAKGCYPYPSDSYASIFSQLNAIVEDPAPAMDPTKYSPEACDFVNQLLCKSPDQRPRYADIVKHPWLANVDCTMDEMGAYVAKRLAVQGDKGPHNEASQASHPTVTFQS